MARLNAHDPIRLDAAARGGLTRRCFARYGAAALAAGAMGALALTSGRADAAGARAAPGGERARAVASSSSGDARQLRVVATFYPPYDFARKVGGDRVAVSCLVPAGTEPHDWEPSTSDVIGIEQADLFVYNGAGMERWVEDLLDSMGARHPAAVEASEGVTLRELDETDGHDHGHDHEDEGHHDGHDHEEHEHDEGEHDGHDHEDEDADPHVWLDPRNVKVELANIRDALSEVDPAGADVYSANYERWAQECDALDAAFREGLAGVARRSIVVSHEAFGYLCDAYGLEQEPLEGIDADSEPDARRMAQIADFVREHDVRVIFSEELVSPKVAQTIADETGAAVQVLNPVEGLTDEQLAAGEDYFSVMRANLEALKGALA